MKNAMKQKRAKHVRRTHRTRSRIRGTQERPRLTVFRSLRHIFAQVINDETGKVLACVGDAHVDSKGKKPVEVAALVGAEIGKRAKGAGVTEVVFDRGPYLYHGRVKALAQAARDNGLEF